MTDKVVVLELDDGNGDGVSWHLIGETNETVHAQLAERFKTISAEQIKKMNRIDKDEHVREVADSIYVEQFESIGLMADVWREISSLLDDNTKLTLQVKEVPRSEYEAMLKQLDAEDAVDNDGGEIH